MKKKAGGNYTLEAAILLPMILFILLALLYTGFWLHDRSMIQGEVQLIVLKGEAVAKNSLDPASGRIDYDRYVGKGIFGAFYDYGDEADVLEEVLRVTLKEKLLIAAITDIFIELAPSEISIEVKADFDIPIGGIRRFFVQSGTGLAVREKKSFDNSEEFIRVFHIMMDTGKELPGAESVLNNLKKLVDILR